MNKKKLIIIISGILLIGIIIFLLVNHFNKTDSMNGLNISYSDNNISFRSFSKDFTYSTTITVNNTSKENKTYSLEWKDIENSLKKQNNFLYEIKCTGPRCATLGTSQVPVAGFKVFPQVLIEPGKTQEYTITFKYKGSEKGVKFKGKLFVYSEEVKEKKDKKDSKEEKESKAADDFSKDLEKARKNKSKA